MGQKVNPNGFRVGVIKDWNTRWYASKKDFADYLIEDKAIRDYLKKTYYASGVAAITIERTVGKIIVSIHTARPGMLIGKGGEGKSRIGLVMRSILGDSMNTTSIQKIENNRFSRADLENKLLMVDDDMDMSALPKTNYIKSIVTAECKMDLERKGVQSYQSQLYARFLCFGNGALTALHDQSDGFFRRQIVLTTKDRPADRTDHPFLVEKLMSEIPAQR